MEQLLKKLPQTTNLAHWSLEKLGENSVFENTPRTELNFSLNDACQNISWCIYSSPFSLFSQGKYLQ